MKRMTAILVAVALISFFGINVLAAEAPKTTPPAKSHTQTDTSVQRAWKIQKIEGTVVNVDTVKNTITIKKSDGSEITLKATSPKTQEEIKKVKTGESISVLCKESKKEGMVLKNVIKEKPDKGKKKQGKK
ncbi:MAG: hypothetical protein NC913_03120 [Candidatus Omnitrophica bacterium]|nr:hypothetical protein [Candidatus Omnitrophota bacterium]